MLIASQPHPRASQPLNTSDRGKSVSIVLAKRRPYAVVLGRRRARK